MNIICNNFGSREEQIYVKLMKKIQDQSKIIKSYFETQISNIKGVKLVNDYFPQKLKAQIQKLKFEERPSLFLKSNFSEKVTVNQNINAIKWVDHKCKDFKNIRFSQQIQQQLSVQKQSYIFGAQVLKNNYQISIHNKKSVIKAIGIIDVCYKQKQKIENLENVIWYEHLGFLQNGKVLQKIATGGYQQGSLVQMRVDLSQGIIQWKTGVTTYLQKKYDKLKNKNIKWVPLIVMSYYQKARIKKINNYQNYEMQMN